MTMDFDTFVERWSGRVLGLIGLALIAVAVAGYFELLSPPFSQTPGQRLVRGREPSYGAQLAGFGGLFLLVTGWNIHRYFAKERARDRNAETRS
jgi:hypothetical protein